MTFTLTSCYLLGMFTSPVDNFKAVLEALPWLLARLETYMIHKLGSGLSLHLYARNSVEPVEQAPGIA